MNSLSLVIVLLAALMTPIIMARFHIANVPTAVAEIIVGILLGKTGFNLIHNNSVLTQLSTLGVIILIFLSGMEINFDLFKRRPKGAKADPRPAPLPLALWSYGSILVLSLLLSLFLRQIGQFQNVILATILFSTIALGVVIAALKEKELLSKPFGQTVLLIAAFGEIIPLLALSVYSAMNGSNAKSLWLISLIFVVAIILLLRFRQIYQWFTQIDKSTTQLDIRMAFFIIITLVAVAEQTGAENILGAFLAGMVMKLLHPREETQDKLTSLGYGFFIPIFFIMTGAKLNLRTLLADRATWILIPLFFACFMVAKLGVYFILKRRFKNSNALAGTFLTSTTITLVLPILTVGRNLHVLTTQQSGAFTIAAVLTCLLAPILFNQFYRPEKEDFQKVTVHFIGANLMTIPIAQQLSKGLYETELLTNSEKNYRTYNSEANVKLVSDWSDAALADAQAFDADIVVLAYSNSKTNFKLANQALKAHVPRIIARFESTDLEDEQADILTAQGVEIYNTYTANVTMLRSLIETPSTLKILNATDAGLYEVVVRNRRFAGYEIQHLPFVDQITISRIYRNGQFVAPHGDTQLHLGDHLIFTGNRQMLATLREQVGKLN
ncbi:sodium hydrogen exchanger family protein [Lactobacillus selangorensis]|uniref:Sodium hydrogen exchanger family protein n=1 Tax=Lactobacillus selangorensis TaxID=81857 RepID=A0A0R2G0C1_9LACO|nr:cation:proton antiporter [Lactobacillus selangorensis]KRN28200.1 sodium hydrogen exchanger family protein [Lactobacillus selangorensis]KRN30924.1 sodium hydrogen exchanger family protein [Lactobacillus selangorensis]